jgi:hypothetical protein
MRLSDAADGDVVRIGAVQYRLMIPRPQGCLWRYRDEPEDDWSDDHVWLMNSEPIDEIVTVNVTRAKLKQAANADPLDRISDRADDSLNWKGTVK